MRTAADLWAVVERRELDGDHEEADLLADLLLSGHTSAAWRRVQAWEAWRAEDLEERHAHELFGRGYWLLDADQRQLVDELVEDELADLGRKSDAAEGGLDGV